MITTIIFPKPTNLFLSGFFFKLLALKCPCQNLQHLPVELYLASYTTLKKTNQATLLLRVASESNHGLTFGDGQRINSNKYICNKCVKYLIALIPYRYKEVFSLLCIALSIVTEDGRKSTRWAGMSTSYVYFFKK